MPLSMYLIYALIVLGVPWILYHIYKDLTTFYNPEDTRPMVFLLRDFKLDNTTAAKALDTPAEVVTYENMLIETYQLQQIAQVVSVGHPATTTLTLYDGKGNVEKRIAEHQKIGYARNVYLQGDVDWQKEVYTLMQEATMIVMRPGFSEGVMWEIEQLIKSNFLAKTVLFLQFGTREAWLEAECYGAMKAILEEHAIVLPPYNKDLRFIYFTEGCKPVAVSELSKAPVYHELIKAYHRDTVQVWQKEIKDKQVKIAGLRAKQTIGDMYKSLFILLFSFASLLLYWMLSDSFSLQRFIAAAGLFILCLLYVLKPSLQIAVLRDAISGLNVRIREGRLHFEASDERKIEKQVITQP